MFKIYRYRELKARQNPHIALTSILQKKNNQLRKFYVCPRLVRGIEEGGVEESLD